MNRMLVYLSEKYSSNSNKFMSASKEATKQILYVEF